MEWYRFFRKIALCMAISGGAYATRLDSNTWNYWLMVAIMCIGIDVFVTMGDKK